MKKFLFTICFIFASTIASSQNISIIDGQKVSRENPYPVFDVGAAEVVTDWIGQRLSSNGDGTGVTDMVVSGKTVTAVAATTPNVVTAASHGYTTNSYVYLLDTSAIYNGLWKIGTVPTANTFSLLNSVGGGAAFSGTGDSYPAYVIKPPADKTYILSRLNLISVDTKFLANGYMNLSALSNGFTISHFSGATSRSIQVESVLTATPVLIYAQWGLNSGPVDSPKIETTDNAVGGMRWTFNKGGGNISLHGPHDDLLALIQRDDMTGIDKQQASVQGYQKDAE